MELKLLIVGVVLFFVSRIMRKVQPRIVSPKAKKIYDEIYEWVETGWSAVLLAAVLMYFVIQAFKIPSGSMRMTFLEGDHLFVNKYVYGFHNPLGDGRRFWPIRHVQRGDIVVFRCPPSALSMGEREEGVNKDFIKRCVALGGDMVEVKNKKLYVNNQPVNEPYVNFVDPVTYPFVRIFPTQEQYQRTWESGRFNEFSPDAIRDNFGPVMVPPGNYFVMGDNRDKSFDSRFWGPLPDKLLKGKALFLYWPINRIRIIKS
ncbi:MAG: signal peptidase I [Endomicrobiales bacterium]